MTVLARNPARTTTTPRHRRSRVRDQVATALDVVGRLGSLVTLAALLVLAGAVGGLGDGSSVTSDATMTVTFEHP